MENLTARQRSAIATAQAVAASTKAQAEAEKEARKTSITGTVTGYDEVTGDWLVETPDGGTLRTQSLSNASLAGKQLPIQRFEGSQTSTVNAPPTDADGSWVVNELEALQRDVVALGAVQVQDRDPAGAADARYPGDKWLNNTTPALFIWDAAAGLWVETGGGGGASEMLVMSSNTLDMTIPSNSLTGVIVDFNANGFTPLRDDLGFYDPANPTRINFAQAGAYRCTFKAIFDGLDTLNTFTNWFAAMRLNDGVFDNFSWTEPRGDINAINSDSIRELTFYLQPTAGQFATLDIQQANNSAANRFVYYQNRSFFTVEKIA